MDLDDPYVRRLSQLVLGLLVATLLAVSSLSLAITIDWFISSGAGPGGETLVMLGELLPKLSGSQASEISTIVSVFLIALPVTITSISFRRVDNTRRLTVFGRILAAALLFVLLISAVAYLYLNPSGWADGHDLGAEGLVNVQEWTRTALRGAAFYLATLLGLKVSK